MATRRIVRRPTKNLVINPRTTCLAHPPCALMALMEAVHEATWTLTIDERIKILLTLEDHLRSQRIPLMIYAVQQAVDDIFGETAIQGDVELKP
jgi:hypothetical protein